MAALLYLDWSQWEAFKKGVIDKTGKQLKDAVTPAEQAAWTYFHRLAANLKRLIETIPGGKSKIGKLVAAYALYKEDTDDQSLFEGFDTATWVDSMNFVTEEYIIPKFNDYIKL
ncbi:hypothetical protein D3C75_470580 [compost metagenome]